MKYSFKKIIRIQHLRIFICTLILLCCHYSMLFAQGRSPESLFLNPPESARPWVYWYWMNAAISCEGIAADLKAMKEAGIAGAYIFTIKGATNPPLFEPVTEQLTPEWWEMLSFTLEKADSLGLKIAFHLCDGFTTAGGPWITPELSMQKVVWSDTVVQGPRLFYDRLSKPESLYDYYDDIALFALPLGQDYDKSTSMVTPEITTSIPGTDAQFLAHPDGKEVFRSDGPCWIQYAFNEPFTCRSIKIKAHDNNLQSLRLLVEASDDGKSYYKVCRLEPPRHGWQDASLDHTYAVPPVTAKFYRFYYDKEGTEPGSEDFDAAKWRQSLKIEGIELSGFPVIDQYEGKSGVIWRVSPATTRHQLPDSLAVPVKSIINISDRLDRNSHLIWDIPAGKWMILRMGCTTTGRTNYMGGRAKGLECDKLNPEAVQVQFDNWIGKLINKTDTTGNKDILKILHVDSWECGSQNWSPYFRKEFLNRRGYDLLPYMSVFAGIPVESTDISERFLYDVRRTIAELVNENFFGTLSTLAHDNGLIFSAENPSPVMVCDGMMPFGTTDIPMGEFWLNSPTHDKPNDILDAVSAGHLYGKSIIQAESFTTLRMTWNEFPGMMKTLGDRNYALGINRLVYHVFTHNPWIDRRPGMTLSGVGLYFQRDQTWWKPGKAWVEYASRCQALLQEGIPVADIAVYTGEGIPTRALTPDRLVTVLPGLFGRECVEREEKRLANNGLPVHEVPEGVTNEVNNYRQEQWINPLRGYRYDSFNRDALLHLAKVKNGCITLPGGMSYKILVIPGSRKMAPDGNVMSDEVAIKLLELVRDGATIMVVDRPQKTPGLKNYIHNDTILAGIIGKLWNDGYTENYNGNNPGYKMWRVGKGKVFLGPWYCESLADIGIERDFAITGEDEIKPSDVAWNHRVSPDFETYFVSNQSDTTLQLHLSLRSSCRIPEIFDPVTGDIFIARQWQIKDGRTMLPVRLEPHGSLFVVLRKAAIDTEKRFVMNWPETKTIQVLKGDWQVAFDSISGGPSDTLVFQDLTDWSQNSLSSVKYYSGTAVYQKYFSWDSTKSEDCSAWIDLGTVNDIAKVSVNGRDCGVAWTYPFSVEITGTLRNGENLLMIEVTNTWANRLTGDHGLSEIKRVSWTTAPYRLDGKALQPSGLIGPVKIFISSGL